MAKNDKKKTEELTKQQTATQQKGQDATMGSINATQDRFNSAYDQAVPMQMGDYRSIMDQYKAYGQNAPESKWVTADHVNYSRSGEMDKAMKGYGRFADDGGFSSDDLTSMRSRAQAPVQSVYNNMQNEMSRQKNIQGGYSPNFNAASAKMRAGTSQQMSDVLQQVNGHIAEMVQSGKLSGLQGLGGLANADAGFDQNAQIANQSASLQAGMANQRMAAYDPRLQAINAQASLYGQTPGMMGMLGNQMMGNQAQMLQGGQNQLAIGNQALQGRELANNTASNFEVGFDRFKQGANMVSQFAAPFMNPTQNLMPGQGQVQMPPITRAYGQNAGVQFGNTQPVRF